MEGWTWLVNSPKWHYFIYENGYRSLCGRWGLFVWPSLPGDVEQKNDNSPDNCKACVKKLARRKLAAPPPERAETGKESE